MQIATSYFYQIRHFTPNMIPVSTCLSDPVWYRPPADKEYYIDKNGVVNGLRYEPLIVQKEGNHTCPCEEKEILKGNCPCMQEYSNLLHSLVDKEKTLKAFQYCADKFSKELQLTTEPVIVLIVYETENNFCSERKALQEFFNCKELKYPISGK